MLANIENSNLSQISILLVEDDDVDARKLDRALKDYQGIKIIRERSIAAALQSLAKEKFDIIILDIGLPDAVSPQDSIQRLKAMPETDIPIIVFTRHDDDKLTSELLAAGAQDYIVKSRLEGRLLQRNIQFALERQKVMTQLRAERDELNSLVMGIREGTIDTIVGSDATHKLIRLLDAEVVDENKRLVEKLKKSNDELEEFSYIASHDLKEPLFGISNQASFLIEDYGKVLDEKGIERLNRIKILSHRIEQLVSDLLYFSGLSHTDEAVVKVNTGSLAQEIIDTFRDSEIDATIEMDGELPEVICDKTRVKEVFRNLISNAIKYNNSEDKRVNVGILEEREDGAPVFYVKDNGIGIEEKYKDYIFKIFKRLHSKDAYSGGTGAGLTFVKKIVEKHKGRIWLESECGKGTTFYFTLGNPNGSE